MIRGIYAAASGMMAEMERSDTIANNLANANTAGFKKDTAITRDFKGMLISRINDGAQAPVIGTLGTGVMVDEVATNHAAGGMRPTGNDLDMAIDGQGFFSVETPTGIRYTRNGTFSLNSRSELVTQNGHRVLGQNGPIVINKGGKVTVSPDGRIFADNIQVNQLQVLEFADNRSLIKEGDSLFNAGQAQSQPATGQVKQGMLEQANVNVISEMVNLIAGYRAYEVNAKTVQAHDQLLDKAVNDVGRV